MNHRLYRRRLVLGLGLVFLWSGPAQAQEQERSVPLDAAAEKYIDRAFKRIDTNHDGHIEPAEWHAYLTAYLARQQAGFERGFNSADTNHDGKLSRVELQAANPTAAKYFDLMDTNHDGFLSQQEMRAALRQRQLAELDQ